VRFLLRLLHTLPRPGGEGVLVAAALAHGLLSPARRRRAWAWAAQQPGSEGRPRALAQALLAERGRYLATMLRIGERDVTGFRRRLVLQGREHLDAVYGRTGALLIDFHLGAGATPLVLAYSGYRVVYAARGEAARWQDLWRHEPARRSVPFTLPPEDLVLWGDLMSRVAALTRIRRELLADRVVYLTADGVGREAFRVPLPGRSLVVRSGWLVARRAAAVPALPVLTHREGRRLVTEIHPPLPPPAADEARDLERCRDHLTPILLGFVRRYPEQCFALALDRPPPESV
jgi:lauroyl/myristoyl acyltransferase